MKQIEPIATAANFSAINIGKLNELNNYVLELGPDVKIPGKVFGGTALQATGGEFSFQMFQPGTETGFLHTHKTHEELYFFLMELFLETPCSWRKSFICLFPPTCIALISRSVQESICTERTKLRCTYRSRLRSLPTPKPRCCPEHSKQTKIPYDTEAHWGLAAPQSAQTYRKQSHCVSIRRFQGACAAPKAAW